MAITQTITPLSTPPSTQDVENFNDRADDFLAQLPTMVTQVNTTIGQINTTEANINAKEASATTAASTATTQAGIATTKASAAAASATAAYNAQLAAEAIFDNFDDKYIGAKASAPTTDNDGNALTTGALFYKTTAPKGIYVYDAELYAWNIFSFVPTAHGSLSGRSDANVHPISSITGVTAFARTLLDDADAATARATLGAADVYGFATQLSLSASTTLTTAAHAGRVLVVTTAGITITLPASPGSGKTFIISSSAGSSTLVVPGNTDVGSLSLAQGEVVILSADGSSPAFYRCIFRGYAAGNAPKSNPNFTGTISAEYIKADSVVQGTTHPIAGAGVRVCQPSGNATPAILQFTNYEVNSQLASISATPGIISLNATTIAMGSNLKSQNGYTTLPNGLILQWGRCTDQATVVFPIAFPTECFSVSAISFSTNNGVPRITSGVSPTGFFMNYANAVGGTCTWMAIGY